MGAVVGQDAVQPISFALVGDIMLGSDYPDSTLLPPDGGRWLFSYAAPFLRRADVAIGNLEGPITDASTCVKDVAGGRAYAFRMPPGLAPLLAEAGFDVLNIANNHANDFGPEGIEDTKRILDSLGIEHTGLRGEFATLVVSGVSIAVVGFSTSPGGNSLLDVDGAAALVESLSASFDIVVVTFHGGAEGVEHAHLPAGCESFLGEARGDLRRFAHAVVDAGADIVFGHGPHVPRALEIYNGKPIAYSLGNFCTWRGISVSGPRGYAPMLWVELDCEGNLMSLDVLSFEQSTNHYPVLDPSCAAAKFMLELSKVDVASFPFELLQAAGGERYVQKAE